MQISIFFSDGMEERERGGKQREGREKIGEGRDRERIDQSIACGKGKYCLIKFVYQLYVC